MTKSELYPDDLKAAFDFITYLNDNHGDGSELFKYSGRIQIENPEHGAPIGWAVWHGDGFWMFRPLTLGGES